MEELGIPKKHHLSTFTPRFRDTDRVGHVNNAVFATYIEIARVDWWRLVRKEYGKNPMTFIMARVEIDYRAPIHLDDNMAIVMWVSRFGTKSWEFSYVIYNVDTHIVHARAKSVQVGFNYKENRTIVINEKSKEFLSRIYNE